MHTWTAEEYANALAMPWKQFRRSHPDLSKGAWCGARFRARDFAQREDLTPSLPPPLSLAEVRARRAAEDDLSRLAEALARAPVTSMPPIPSVTAPIEDFAVPLTQAPPTGKRVIRYEDFEASEDITDDEFAERFIAWQHARNRRFKDRLDHRIRIPLADDGLPICIAFPSDWHLGNQGTDHTRIIEDVQLFCSHPRTFVALGGDPIDNFILEKMISASRSMLAQVDAQWVLFRWLVEKLVASNSLLFVGAGNHDAWTQRVAGIDGLSSALRGLPVLNTGEGGYVEIEVGTQTYGLYRKHKPTRFNSSYNSTHFLKQMLRTGTPWDFDIGVSEHLHTCSVEHGEYRPGTGRDRVFITTGSYKVRDHYAEDIGYYGGGYGVPAVILWPGRKEMLPFKHLAHAIQVIDALAATGTPFTAAPPPAAAAPRG